MLDDPTFAILDPAQLVLQLRSDLLLSPLDRQSGGSWLVEDPVRGKFFQLGAREHSLARHFNGCTTIAAAVANAAGAAGIDAINVQEAIVLARWLVDNGLARPQLGAVESPGASAPPKPAEAKAKFNPLSIKLPPIDPDPWLARLTLYFAWLWTRWALFGWLTCGVCAAVKLANHAAQWQARPSEAVDPQNWFRLGVVMIALKLLHEMAHGLSCKHFGAPVRRAGLMLLFLAPVPFVDVTAAWRLASRRQRMIVSAAGMYVETFAAFLAVLWWTPGSTQLVDRLCADVALMAGLHTLLFNANPLMRFDGYFILSDALGIPNLAASASRRTSEFAKHWCGGVDVPRSTEGRARETLLLLYGLGALAWRTMVFLSIGLGIIAAWGLWGAAVTPVFGWFWFGCPGRQRDAKSKTSGARSPAANRRRLLTLGAGGLAAATLAGWLASPAHVSAPAVVEYAPLSVLRAEAAGFVTRVFVNSGQTVEAGEALAEIRSDEVASELTRLEIKEQQARLRSRLNLQNGDVAKHQSDESEIDSLQQRLHELRSQLAALIVRAPMRGQILERDAASLAGRYVKRGDVLLTVGAEESKEVVASVSPREEPEFARRAGQQVEIRWCDRSPESGTGTLSPVEPRADDKLPHDALGASAGGEVVVRPARQDEAEGEGFRSLEPRFTAKIALDPELARRLPAGRRVTVGLADSSQTWAGRLLARLEEQLDHLAKE